MPDTLLDPTTPSGDYSDMQEYWQLVTDLYEGADAVRAAGETYLPKFESETESEYNDRVAFARYTNIYRDIVEMLASKPFSKEVKVDNASDVILKLIEDVDGQNNNLHVFAYELFLHGVNEALVWLLVDYSNVNPFVVDANGRSRRRSVAEERQSGARPYWSLITALEMVAVRSAMIDGVEQFVHMRALESFKEPSENFEEVEVNQVREITRDPIFDAEGNIVGYDRPRFAIWRQEEAPATKPGETTLIWKVIEKGDLGIDVIPLVPLVIGLRKGTSWQVIGAMKDCAYLQIDLYQQEVGLQNARQLTAFPMLTGNNVAPPDERPDGSATRLIVGPRRVLYAAPSEGGPASWEYLEITAQSLRFLASQIEDTKKELRELGRQPLTAQSSNLTVITTAFAAEKGNSAVQSWALRLKDALENAFKFTAMWLRDSREATVNVDTEFDSGLLNGDSFANVLAMRKSGDLSRDTVWREARRRRVLGDEFDSDAEETLLLEESDMTNEDDEMAALELESPVKEEQ